jgi:DMSO reductase family type II enzyme chaperone
MGFRYPEPDGFRLIADGDFRTLLRESLTDAHPGLAAGIGPVVDGLTAPWTGMEGYESEYLTLFHTNMPTPSVSLYEGSYVPGVPKSSVLLELRGFYEAFGLAIGTAGEELEDGLGAELEFMQFLAGREAMALDSGQPVRPYVLARRDFLSRHLGVWLPRFGQALSTRSGSAFFHDLARVAEAIVAADHATTADV